MNAARQSLCLNMIVKNEAPVIRRCIDSVRPLIDHWVIVDTGSTDGTQDIIRGHLHDVPGQLYERPWRDFAHNRSDALRLARGKADYTLIIDADDTLDVPANTSLPALNADSYMLEIHDSSILYRRIQMVRSALQWRYEGVLHEFLTCEDASSSELLPGIRMLRNHDGARRKDPHTYLRDAAVLEKALHSGDPTPFLRARYRFYLAQSYRDCGDRLKALEHYIARAGLGFWQEEVFISLYRAAQIKEQLGYPEQEVIAAYLQAADALPTRAEALHGVSRFCRHKKRYDEGYRLARRGLEIPMPSSDALFVEPSVYDVGLLDEFALNAYWAGHNLDALNANLKLLGTGKLSAADTQRVLTNARFASERLPAEQNLACATESLVHRHISRPGHSPASHSIEVPRVLVAILAGPNERMMPAYLACIEALDYPKSSIVLYIRTYATSDATERTLREWAGRVGHLYGGVEFDVGDLARREEPPGHASSSTMQFRVPASICQYSLGRAAEHECEFYFVASVGTFIRPCVLRELVGLNLPIVAPLLKSIRPDDPHSNYHADIDARGYYKECAQYGWVLNRWIRGVLEMPVVNSTYLIQVDVLNDLAYEDGTSRHEYVIFSESARRSGTPQYLDNREVYGYHAFGCESMTASEMYSLFKAHGLVFV